MRCIMYTHPEMMMGMAMFGIFALFTVFVLACAIAQEEGD